MLTVSSRITFVGLFCWLLWAIVNGAQFEVWGVTADEVAAGLDVLWKSLVIAGPATSVVYRAMTLRSTQESAA